MGTCFLIRDMNGVPAPNVPLEVEWSNQRRHAVSGADSVARFSEDIPADATLITVGLATATRIACESPPPPVPGDGDDGLPTGTEPAGVGCYLIRGTLYKWEVHTRKDGTQIAQSDIKETARTYGMQDPRCQEQWPPLPGPGGVTEDRVRQLIGDVISGLQDLISSILKRLTSAEANIEEIVARAEEEATAWRAALDAAGASLWSTLDIDVLAPLAELERDIASAGAQFIQIFTVEIPKLWTTAQEIVQHAEDEAKAWRAEVAGIWEKLEAWLVERIVDIVLRGLDREAQK